MQSIWAPLSQAAGTLPEPFGRRVLIAWVAERRPDVATSSISTHIQYATAETPNRGGHRLGRRPPVLERIARGLHRRYREAHEGGPCVAARDVPAGTSRMPTLVGGPARTPFTRGRCK